MVFSGVVKVMCLVCGLFLIVVTASSVAVDALLETFNSWIPSQLDAM